MTTLILTDEEIELFKNLQKHHEVIGYLIGYMESLKLTDLKNVNIQLDIDDKGIVGHMSITKHYRR